MDIACPTCEAAYEIDDATVGADGRKVRCAACGTVWRVFRAAPVMAGDDQASGAETAVPGSEKGLEAIAWRDPSPAPDAEAFPQAPTPPPDTQTRKARWVKDRGMQAKGFAQPAYSKSALGLVAATGVLLGVAIHQRAAIVQHVPQSARLFAMLRMPVNLRGIEIKGVASRVLDDNGVSVLVVDGDLVNVTGGKVDVPRLRFAVLGPAGQEVYVWSAQADRASLQPGETLNFRRRLAAPPGDARNVSVRFVTKADITAGIK
jgi:predicted Zn finger-like uncharacterized protein